MALYWVGFFVSGVNIWVIFQTCGFKAASVESAHTIPVWFQTYSFFNESIRWKTPKIDKRQNIIQRKNVTRIDVKDVYLHQLN